MHMKMTLSLVYALCSIVWYNESILEKCLADSFLFFFLFEYQRSLLATLKFVVCGLSGGGGWGSHPPETPQMVSPRDTNVFILGGVSPKATGSVRSSQRSGIWQRTCLLAFRSFEY